LTAPDRNYYPACYPTVIGVGAAEGQKTAKFSQRNGVSLLAPGVNLPAVTHRNAPESVTRSGSSYACATVSGLCAAILTQQPELTPAQVRERLFIEAADIEQAGFDTDSGWGLVGQKQNAPIRRDALLSSLYRYDCYTHAQTPEEGTAAFNWAIQQAISDGSKLEDNITREQLATILYRYEKATPVQLNLNAFTDQNTISDFAKNAMAWAVQTGILMGNNGKLNPQGNATRAELTNFIHP
ncbi:MAG: S8 family serine peptidase, partial [Evtepia sp.]